MNKKIKIKKCNVLVVIMRRYYVKDLHNVAELKVPHPSTTL